MQETIWHCVKPVIRISRNWHAQESYQDLDLTNIGMTFTVSSLRINKNAMPNLQILLISLQFLVEILMFPWTHVRTTQKNPRALWTTRCGSQPRETPAYVGEGARVSDLSVFWAADHLRILAWIHAINARFVSFAQILEFDEMRISRIPPGGFEESLDKRPLHKLCELLHVEWWREGKTHRTVLWCHTDFALQTSLFSSAYFCERSFASLTIIKTQQRRKLDIHAAFRLPESNLQPRLDLLVTEKQQRETRWEIFLE